MNRNKTLSAVAFLFCIATVVSMTMAPASASYFAVYSYYPAPRQDYFTSDALSQVNYATGGNIIPYTYSHTFTIKVIDLSSQSGMVRDNIPDPYSRILDVYVRGVLYTTLTVNPSGNTFSVSINMGWFDSALITFKLHWGGWDHVHRPSSYTTIPTAYFSGWMISW